VVVAVVVVVVVVVVALVASGVLTPSSSHGQGVTGTPLSYSQVASEGAQGILNQSSTSGPVGWTLVAVEGLGLTTSASGSNAQATAGSGCAATPASGAPSSTILPATPTGSPSGTAAVWVFLATGSGGDLLFYVVTQAASYPLFVLSGSCTDTYDELGNLSGYSVVDSTVVAASANAAGGSAFLSSNPNSLQAYALFGPGLSGSSVPYWAVEYNTCDFSTSGTGTIWASIYNAENGSVVTSPLTESTSC